MNIFLKIKPIFLFVIFLLFSVVNVLYAQVDVGDSLALVDLYNSTGGTNWTNNTNWLTGKPVNEWHGIKVENRSVTTIYLGANNLKGKLPESIGNFDSLVTLFLPSNHLNGSLPASIGNLKTVQEMEFIDNDLTGKIPSSVGNMTQLTEFVFNDNKLTGNIPATIGNCKNLTDIEFYLNKLSGPVPASLNNCIKLKTVWLASNKLTGSLPSLLNLTELYYFDVSNNLLSGSIENTFAENAPLGSLLLSDNQFSGILPNSLGSLLQLQQIYVNNNRFTGSLPATLGRITPLLILNVSNNQLSGNVPLNIFSLPYIQYIYLDNNQLTNEKNPSYNGGLVKLAFVSVQKNRFTFNGLEYLIEKFGGHVTVSPQAILPINAYKNKLAVSAGGTLNNNTYNWFRVGDTIPVVVTGDSTFQPIQSGRYYATVNNNVVARLTLLTDTVVYAMPVKNELKITVSPNPAREVIGIYGLNEKSDTKITIADMNGNVWLKAFSHQQSVAKCNVSRLKAGNYLVNVSNGKAVKTIQFLKE